jgi:hypothetical protein
MSQIYLTAPIIAMFLVSCDSKAPTRPDDRQQAIQATYDWWKRTLPKVPVDELDMCVVREGGSWKITYTPPFGSAGGPFTFKVNRGSHRIENVDVRQ